MRRKRERKSGGRARREREGEIEKEREREREAPQFIHASLPVNLSQSNCCNLVHGSLNVFSEKLPINIFPQIIFGGRNGKIVQCRDI